MCTYALCCVVSWGQNACGRGGSGEQNSFTFYCMPSAEWLTEFASPGSETMEKSWGAEHRGGCGLAIRELYIASRCWLAESLEQHVQPQAGGGSCLGHRVLLNLMFYPIMFPFTLLQGMISLLPRI